MGGDGSRTVTRDGQEVSLDDVVLGHWWGWLLGFVAMVAFWGLVIWGLWYFLTSLGRRPEPPSFGGEPADPKRILDERLARGEIDTDEYQRLLDLIRGQWTSSSSGPPPVGAAGPR